MKKYYSALLFLGLTAGLFSACDNDEEVVPDAPQVSIENLSGTIHCSTNGTVSLKAQLANSTQEVSFLWFDNQKEVSMDSIFEFTSTEIGIHNITLLASNPGGKDSDTLQLNVYQPLSINDIVNWTGIGENRSVLAIQWVTGEVEDLLNPDDENIFFRAWGYRWKAGEEKTGIEMIKAIVKQDPRLYMVYNTSWDMVTGFIYDRDNDKKIHISNGTIDLTQDDFEEGIYYAESTVNFDNLQVGGEDLWLGGSENAYASYFTFDDSPSIPEQFEYAQVGVALRPLTNNSWDVYTFSPQNAEWLNTNPRPYLLEAAEAN